MRLRISEPLLVWYHPPMKYTLDQLTGMKARVEELGGAMLPEVCTGHPIKYQSPQAGGKDVLVRSQSCGEATLFVLPYEPSPNKTEETEGFIRACLICDDVGRWPLFRDITLDTLDS